MRRFWKRPSSESARLERIRLRRERARKGLSLIPSALTLGNLVCGFAAIIRVALIKFNADGTALAEGSENSLFYAGCLIFLAMIFDALDGRVARMTKSTSDFGGELDSLCDAITFGVTPAIMIVLLNPISRFPEGSFWGQAAWIFGVAYACGAVLRLARFNVGNTHDEGSHKSFEGLPTPAAAGVIASLTLFYNFLLSKRAHQFAWLGKDLSLEFASWILFLLPLVALGLGYLMISRHRYVHVVNVYLRGRTRFEHLNSVLVVVALVALFVAYLPETVGVVIFGGFALSGPFATLRRRMREGKQEPRSALDHRDIEESDDGGLPSDEEILETPSESKEEQKT